MWNFSFCQFPIIKKNQENIFFCLFSFLPMFLSLPGNQSCSKTPTLNKMATRKLCKACEPTIDVESGISFKACVKCKHCKPFLVLKVIFTRFFMVFQCLFVRLGHRLKSAFLLTISMNVNDLGKKLGKNPSQGTFYKKKTLKI